MVSSVRPFQQSGHDGHITVFLGLPFLQRAGVRVRGRRIHSSQRGGLKTNGETQMLFFLRNFFEQDQVRNDRLSESLSVFRLFLSGRRGGRRLCDAKECLRAVNRTRNLCVVEKCKRASRNRGREECVASEKIVKIKIFFFIRIFNGKP